MTDESSAGGKPARHASSQARLRRAGVPWRMRRGCVRPGAAGLVAGLAIVALWLVALTFDARVLVAAAIAWTAVWLMSGCWGVVQSVAVRRIQSGRPVGTNTAADTAAGTERIPRWRRLCHAVMLPHDIRTVGTYIRLNPEEYVGSVPDQRGWYRRVGMVLSWREPLGLFVVRTVIPDDAELVILPEPGPVNVTAGEPASGARGGGRATFGFAGLREYEPGDPVRSIAWKRSVSAGRLMVKRAPRSMVHAVMLVCDMASCTTDAQVDAVAYAAMSRYAGLRAGLERHGGKLIVTDGQAVATSSGQTMRLIASLQGGGDADHMAATVCNAASAQHMPVNVVVITASASSTASGVNTANGTNATTAQGIRLVASLRAAGQPNVQTLSVQGDHASYRLRSYEMDDSEDDAVEGSEPLSGRASARRHIRRVGAWLPAAHESGPNHDHTPAGQSGRRRWVATQAAGLLVRTTIVALTMELSVQWALMLVQGKGLWWPVFARIGVAALAVTSQIPTPRRFKRRRLVAAIRGIAFVLAALVTGVVTAGLRLRETLGFLPWHPVYTQVSAGGEQNVVHVPFTQAWGRFATTIASGFKQLYAQVPPLNMGAASDAAVIIAVVGVMLVVRLLAGIPAAIPWMGILPVVVGAAANVSMLQEVPWVGVLLLAASLALAWWSIRPHAASPVMPCVVSVVTMALVMSCTSAGLAFARSVPLTFDAGNGMFSSTTINPMIDLKRSLTAGSSATALTYQSNRARYLRMATLDDFDGDTWNFDATLSASANLYRRSSSTAFVNLQSDVDKAASKLAASSGGYSSAAQPLATYLTYDNGSLDSANVADSWLGIKIAETDVTIDKLSTRLLPVGGLLLDYSGVSGDWTDNSSGGITSRNATTTRGQSYTTTGIYIDPISSSLGFQQIDTIEKAVLTLRDTGHLTVPDAATANAERARWVSSGAAQRVGDLLLIPVTSSDGILTVANSDTFDGALAYEWSKNGYSGDANSNDPGSASMYTLSTSFANAVGFNPNKDSAVLVHDSGGGTWMLALPATVGAADFSDADAVTSLFAKAGMTASSVISVALESGLVDGSDPFARIDALDKAVLARYRSLPAKLPSGVKAVISQAKADGIPSEGSTFNEQEQALQYLVRYFSSNGFTYSLDVPGDETGDDSNIAMVGSFLKRKSGYCAHYASAFAILGRALGVPTRMVLGYSTSGVVDENGSYSVSAKQLHAWDEAYLSGVGWVPFDVTPAASEESSDAGQSPSSAASSSSPSESSSPSASQSASPSASASASSSGSIGGPSSRTQGRDDASQTGLPVRQWMVFLVAVAGLGALCCVPMGIRSRRRRRRLWAFDRAACGGADDDTPVRSAWIGAWRELQDTAWDCGARWPVTATDRDIADVVGVALACEAAGKVAGRAAACVFGHGDVPAPSLKDVADVRAAVEGRRRFMPMSLFRRR
ncbi:MAG: DUF58 domain-containing protein [Bifidobacterium thermophilum]|nr:DUF58 domain-containing protein [Bifidobacterium thermophilum]